MFSFLSSLLHSVSSGQLFLGFCVCYLIGAIPTSYLLARMIKGVDIRTFGSGNSGATNASRLLGIRYFFLILGIDAAKAYAAMVLFSIIYPGVSELFLLCGALCVLLGNAYSVFIQFYGGKAAATAAGLVLYFFPPLVWVVLAGLFLTILAIGQRVDVAVLFSAIGGALYVSFYGTTSVLLMYMIWVLALWVWARHYSNILSLLGKK